MANKKRTPEDIENELQAFIGLRYFSQGVEEYEQYAKLADVVEHTDKLSQNS